jgi:hypothetical protein
MATDLDAIKSSMANIKEPKPSEKLFDSVFTDPIDFLSTLKSVLPKANPGHPDDVSKADLVAYANNGDNAKDRAAAAVAAAHYDDLRKMPADLRPLYQTPIFGGLNANEINFDIDMVKGNIQDDATKLRNHDWMVAAVNGAGSVASLAGAAASVEVPPLAVLLAGVSVANAASGGYELSQAQGALDILRADSQKDRQAIAAWPEFDRSNVR